MSAGFMATMSSWTESPRPTLMVVVPPATPPAASSSDTGFGRVPRRPSEIAVGGHRGCSRGTGDDRNDDDGDGSTTHVPSPPPRRLGLRRSLAAAGFTDVREVCRDDW